MAWQQLAKWARQLVAAAMAVHAVPRHVAFIMDGNRRYAEKRHLRKVEGHQYGYEKLIDALEWCLELGVECVSVYAFSIDNYKRSQQEVELLMHLAEQKLASMLEEQDVLVRHGVQVRVIGDLSLAPPSVQQAAARVMEATQHHTQAVLNICFSYTSSEEMLQALHSTAGHTPGTSDNSCQPNSCKRSWDDVGGFLDDHLYTQGCPPIDLLIRTSGETRLSDFLLWQSRHALLVFTHVLWPDFGFLDLLSALVSYQRSKPTLDRCRRVAETALQEHERATWRGAKAAQALAAAATASATAATSAVLALAQMRQRPAQTQQRQQQLLSSPFQARQPGVGCQSSEQEQQHLAGGGPPSILPKDSVELVDQTPEDLCGSYGSDGIAVVKAFHLGGESPCGGSPRAESPCAVAFPESPSSPSANSGDTAGSPKLHPSWTDSPQRSSSGHSTADASPQPYRQSGFSGAGNGFHHQWPGGKRLGSVESFCSIDLTGDCGGGIVQRARLSYQDLTDALCG